MRLTLALLALAALGLLGCSADDNSTTTTGKRKPLKVQHAMGETRVPYRGMRPATLDPAALETALALGVRPVGSATPDGSFPAYLQPRVRGITNLGPARDPDVRATLLLDPDVVIGNELLNARVYKQLEDEEPTVMSGIPIREWKADVRFFGEALGRTDESEELLNAYDGQVASTRRALERSSLSGRAALSALSPGLRSELDSGFLAEVFSDVGLRPPATIGRGRAGGLLAARMVLEDLQAGASR